MNNVMLPKKAQKHQFPVEEIILKDDHENFSLWINYDALIILETFKQNSKQASDFLIAIAEPVSRPKYIHDALFCDAMERDMRRETQMMSYNKYINASGRMTPSPNYNMMRMDKMGEIDHRNINYSHLENNTQHYLKEPMRIFDPNINSQKYIPDYLRHTPTAPMRVYPEYTDYEPDPFYKDSSLKNDINFYGNHKQISPSEISKPHSRKDLSIEDFDFLKARIDSRSKEEAEKKKKLNKKISLGENSSDIFGGY